MRLTPMRYKDYIWPSNPGSYRISFRRVVAEHKLPFGRSVTQDLGQVCRVLEGEGEFAGEGAYEEFKRLATVFYGGGAGVLVHPVWMTTRAYFTELEVVQEPLPDYVRYRFAFCEAGGEGAALKEVSTSAAGGSAAGTAGARYHTVVQGDTLWAIAARNGTTVRALCALNPQIANPNRIYPGRSEEHTSELQSH